MTYQPYLIAPFEKDTGLNLYFKPWLIGDKAFQKSDNMYSWRGAVRKRSGYEELARLPATGSISSISNATPAVVTLAAPHGLIAPTPYHIWLEGIVDANYTDLNDTLFIATVTGANSFSLQNLEGVNIPKAAVGAPAGAAGTAYQPCQSLAERIIPNSLDEELIAFSQTQAFRITPGVATNISFFQTLGTAITWTGDNLVYYWSTNFAQALWVTNNVDPVRFYNGSTTQGWNNQRFQTNGTDFVHRARIVIPFKQRLVLLDTSEGNVAPGTRFAQRARWSQIGTPYVPATGGDPAVVVPTLYSGAVDANAWRSDIAGRGGFVDAPTNEVIRSAQVVNDNLIVFFQYSTWRLRYTGNQVLPFVWEEINSHYGAESTFGTLGFDQMAFAFNRTGFIGADTNNVRRIDDNIPDLAFEVETGTNNEELNRVQAARDYYRNFFYWTYGDAATNARTPNRILAMNYDDQSWSIFEINIRCFARYKDTDDRIWSNYTNVGVDEWENQGGAMWFFGQDNFFELVGGQDDGRIQILFSQDGPSTDNGDRYGFDLRTKRFNPFIQEGKESRLAYFDIYTTGVTGGEITIEHYIDADDNTPVEVRTVNLNTEQDAKYTRIFLGTVAEFHQIRFYLNQAQIDNEQIGAALFELQGIVMWMKPEARIKAGALL